MRLGIAALYPAAKWPADQTQGKPAGMGRKTAQPAFKQIPHGSQNGGNLKRRRVYRRANSKGSKVPINRRTQDLKVFRSVSLRDQRAARTRINRPIDVPAAFAFTLLLCTAAFRRAAPLPRTHAGLVLSRISSTSFSGCPADRRIEARIFLALERARTSAKAANGCMGNPFAYAIRTAQRD
jgi:hypothetical protein